MRHTDPLVTGALIVIGLSAVAILLLFDAARSFFNKRKSADRIKQMANDAEMFFASLEGRVLPPVETPIVLKDGECAFFQEPSILYESRSYRVFGGGGTRIGGIYVGGGASEGHERLRQIDSGILILTNQRLVFDGQTQSRAVNVKDVISATPWSDAKEVSSSRKQKSQIYTVGNPLVWAPMIKLIAQGKFSMAAAQHSKGGIDRSDILASGEKKCPGCGERLMKEAVRCRYCQFDFR